MSALVITIPADRAAWGPVQPVAGGGCRQACSVYVGDQITCNLVMHWPEQLPSVPVVAVVDGRHAGPRD